MKNFFLGIITVVILGGIAFGAYYLGTKKQNINQTAIISPTSAQASPTVSLIASETPPTTAPSPTVQQAPDNELIKAALFKKHNWSESDGLTVTISTNDGTYASGGVTAQGGGGYFSAAKVNGEWQIVADGNGVVTCASLTNYPNYPKTLIPECWDEATGNVVKR